MPPRLGLLASVVILFSLYDTAVYADYVVKRYRFTVSDSSRNANYPDGIREVLFIYNILTVHMNLFILTLSSQTQHHCILFSDNTPVFVVGTYSG
jgi:hypothetical protein